MSLVLAASAAPPPNDDFANRVPLRGLILTTYGANVDATREASEPYHWQTDGGQSVWWSWTSPANGRVSITSPANGSSFNAPASIGIAANASDSDGSVTSAEFYAGNTLLGQDTISDIDRRTQAYAK